SVFSHLSSPKATDYRRVLDVFATARSEFILHLRPVEVARETGLPEDEIEPLLDQLVEWKNLSRSRDDFEAASIEDFYRKRWLYQLSKEGEAAERALVTFRDSLQQTGELQREALREILQYLEAIRLLVGDGVTPATADYGKLNQQFNHLDARFEEFTAQAQRFMHFLQSAIELHGLSREEFITYKDRLIDYLERFVGELVTSMNEVERAITSLERAEVRRYFDGVANQARVDALDPDDLERLNAERARREGRWDGLRRWFLGEADGRSQAETLRARTREAIPALLITIQNLHDQQQTGADRLRDWRQLAHWFAEAPNDDAAHRLWRVAFALAPARHLRINDETLAYREQTREDARTSWLEAEPMWLDPQLRRSGRTYRSGREPAITDLSLEREALLRLAEAEHDQIVRAQDQLTTEGPTWLSDFAELDPASFDLLLDLLAAGLTEAAGREPDEAPVVVSSSDGSLSIELDLQSTTGRAARLQTRSGSLTGPDYRVTIRSALAV
ncbi:MAG: TIGR02677 family protein, partial [Verrucomicrobiota bacterium]